MERILTTIYEIVECKCGKKYITTQGTDNIYHCQGCGERLVEAEPTTYTVEDSKLIKFVQDNFKPSENPPKRNF